MPCVASEEAAPAGVSRAAQTSEHRRPAARRACAHAQAGIRNIASRARQKASELEVLIGWRNRRARADALTTASTQQTEHGVRVARLAPASRARLSTRHTPQPLSQHVKNASKGPCAVAARAHPSARARPAAESACCVSTRHSREERPAMSCERRTTAAAHASRNILHTRTYKARLTRAHTSWNPHRGCVRRSRVSSPAEGDAPLGQVIR